MDVQVDHAGNLVLIDSGSPSGKVPAQVQVVAASSGSFFGHTMIAGHIYRVAGNPQSLQISGDGGPATNAGIGAEIGELQLDQAGNLVQRGQRRKKPQPS
jgi:hypothetical protein